MADQGHKPAGTARGTLWDAPRPYRRAAANRRPTRTRGRRGGVRAGPDCAPASRSARVACHADACPTAFA